MHLVFCFAPHCFGITQSIGVSMANQLYNGISMCTCVYLICVGAFLLLLVMVNSGCECKNNNWANDNYCDYLKQLVLATTMPVPDTQLFITVYRYW